MATDFILDPETGDLMIKDGDLVIDYSDTQNLDDLMETVKGEIKTSPTTGVGVKRMVKQRQGAEFLVGEARLQMQADGWVEIKASHQDNNLIVEAQRQE
ncbi:MAG: hypothetical protein GC192_23510 [Bacteroidetes bacterium]|nr:hypothetical protein [Bacteroidota bacterium]